MRGCRWFLQLFAGLILRIPFPLALFCCCGIVSESQAAEPSPSAPRLYLGTPISPQAMAQVQDALNRRMEELAEEDSTNTMAKLLILPGPNPGSAEFLKRRSLLLPDSGTLPPAATNAQTFEVKGYQVIGNTLLSRDTLELVFRPYIGPKISLNMIRQALTDLHSVYQEQGFVTVAVRLPQQTLAEGIVKVRVFEGILSDIIVSGNRYFSSNNVMRALPSLRTNVFLSGPILQAELDRANANQDRQIYPEIAPGLATNTTELLLTVKDRLPLHAKVDLNNQYSPGTPALRLNTSAVYNNLWQREHSLGIQYNFSPQQYKSGDQWHFYDKPMVANYSAFYRLPIGNPESMESVVATQPGTFGYNEATRQFQLPPPTGQPELTLYASRSTIDTGLMTLMRTNIANIPGALSIKEHDVQEDLTENNIVGFRLSTPLRSDNANFHSTLSGGLDFKDYSLTSNKTNNFFFSIITVNPNGSINPPINSTVSSPVPSTRRALNYLPLSMRFDASRRDSLGTTTFGFGYTANLWYSGGRSNLQSITGSTKSTGNWLTLVGNLSRDFIIHTNWLVSMSANGQWSSEPLISNEQFGAGGVASVRGYREGEVFGDRGWRTSVELKTPPHVVGLVYGNEQGNGKLAIRGSVYMDYAETYLLDPHGRDGRVPLWGVGFGAAATIGPHWEARMLFSWPLLKTTLTDAGQPRFDFGLTAQF